LDGDRLTGKKIGAPTRHKTRALRCYRIGRAHVDAIDSIAGEKEVATPAIRVSGRTAGVTGKDAMEANVTSIVQDRAVQSDLLRTLLKPRNAKTVVWLTATPPTQKRTDLHGLGCRIG
jgi:hypothetical protein